MFEKINPFGKLRVDAEQSRSIKNKSIPLIIGVSIFCLLIVLSVFAWTGPSGTPPDPNAPAPINVSSSGQEKEGQFGIAIPSGESLDGSYGLTVGTASNPLGIKTAGDSFFESAFTSFKGIAIDDAASGKNLIPNWQMEADTYWQDAPEQASVADFDGVNHYAHRSDETDTGCYNWAHTALIPADANKLYKFSIWIKSDDSTMNNYLGFHIYDSNKTRIVGDWSNPYFKSSEGDANSWKKWTAYLGPSYSGGATGCDSGKTNGNDWCMAANTAYIKMRFGACYGDGGSNGHSWFMYPKIEEVDPDDSYFVGNTVFMDGNVGIGAINPGQSLSVSGNVETNQVQSWMGSDLTLWAPGGMVGSADIYITPGIIGGAYRDVIMAENGGRVGIGTPTPTYELDVDGDISARQLCLKGVCQSSWAGVGGGGGGWVDDGTVVRLETASDNIGIGTTSPGAKLHVYGDSQGNYGVYDTPIRVEADNYTYLELKGANNQAGVVYNRDGSTGWLTGLNNDGKFRIADLASINQTGLTNAKDGSEGITIDTSGNVGIGTTGSSAKLDVAGTDTTGIKYLKSGSKDARIMVGDPGKSWSMAVGWATEGDFSIIEEGIAGDRLYIKQGGNVGIGTTSPGEKLSVNGNISVSGTGMWNHSATIVYSGTPSAETWLTLDLSSYVGANHALVFLRFYDTTSGGSGYYLRTGALFPFDFGSDARTDDTSGCAAVNVRNNNQGIGYVMIETDSDGKTHWKASSARLTQIVLVGYIK